MSSRSSCTHARSKAPRQAMMPSPYRPPMIGATSYPVVDGALIVVAIASPDDRTSRSTHRRPSARAPQHGRVARQTGGDGLDEHPPPRGLHFVREAMLGERGRE